MAPGCGVPANKGHNLVSRFCDWPVLQMRTLSPTG